ncbi:MAG TPA: hypothetical protein VF219_22855, partial [Vicinamibacterales bacterium]
ALPATAAVLPSFAYANRMKSTRPLSFSARHIRIAAERRGWRLTLDDDGFAGMLELENGEIRCFMRSTFDLNGAAATLVARDKALTKFFLGNAGLPVIRGRSFFSPRLATQLGSTRDGRAAARYAGQIGYPVMAKANSGAGGDGIERVSSADGLQSALDRIFASDDIVLIESFIEGFRDVRIVVLDGDVLLAYERSAPEVTGNGTSSLRTLVENAGLAGGGIDRFTRPIADAGWGWDDVPEAGEVVRLLHVANLSQGGLAREVTTTIDSKFTRLATDAAHAIGLRYCGVDLLTADETDGRAPCYILEVNGAPTIHHFARLCRLSEERLVIFHERLLDAMSRSIC